MHLRRRSPRYGRETGLHDAPVRRSLTDSEFDRSGVRRRNRSIGRIEPQRDAASRS
jgi:hypothetical protein